MSKKINYILFILYFLSVTFFSFNYLYKNVKENEIQEYRNTMNKLADISTALINSEDVFNLVEHYNNSLPEKEFINHYNNVNNKLKYIQNLFSEIITYIYIYIPHDNGFVVFLNDAEDDYTCFGGVYDASNFPLMIDAMTAQKILVEEELSFDEEFDVSVISSFAPIFFKDSQIATLGIDSSAHLFDKQIKESIWMSLTLAISIVLLSLACPFSLFYIIEKRRENKYIRDSKKIIKERRKSFKNLLK